MNQRLQNPCCLVNSARHFAATDQDQLTEMLETTRQLSRLNMADKAAELERQIHPEIESLEERIDQALRRVY